MIRFVEDLDEWSRNRTRSSNHRESSVDTVLRENNGESRSATPISIPKGDAKTDTEEITALPPPALPDNKMAVHAADEQQGLQEISAKYGWNLQDCEIVMLSENSFLCPGFVDTHTHAPQVPNLGRGQQYELLDWLQNVTFPQEKRFEDPIYATKTYHSVVQRMLDTGTTCAAIYATLHEEATMILADICNQRGLRAFVGKCQMDRNSPIEYREKSCSASMESTKNFIEYCRSLQPYGTVSPDSAEASHSVSPTSMSPEMEESLARLTASMDGVLNDQRGSESEVSRRHADSITSHDSVSLASTAATSAPSQPEFKKGPPSSTGSIHSHRRGSQASSRKEKETEAVNALVQPILTPRFAISCSDALLASISALVSRDPTLRIQTHLSENEGEIAYTKELFPFCDAYTDVYDHFSLLTPRTILAHAIHLDDREMSLIANRKCGISHCPTSNMNLRSGASRIGEMLNRGIKVGLGTDMSGGFGMSMLSAIRDASVVAKVVQFRQDAPSTAVGQPADTRSDQGRVPALPDEPDTLRTVTTPAHTHATHDFCNGPLPIATLFYLATLGGAEVCSIAHRIGSLDPGKVRRVRNRLPGTLISLVGI